MASSLALRHLLSANRFPKSFTISTICPLAITHSPASKLFNTNALRSSDDDNNESDLNFDRLSSRHFFRRGDDFFSNVFVPFSLRPNLSLMLNLIDRISENPIISMTRTGGARRPETKLARRPPVVESRQPEPAPPLSQRPGRAPTFPACSPTATCSTSSRSSPRLRQRIRWSLKRVSLA
ncbi:hypothetical protein ACFX13_028021 [Malus domestica]